MLTISDFKTLLDNNKLNYQKLNETTIIISNGCEKYNFSYKVHCKMKLHTLKTE